MACGETERDQQWITYEFNNIKYVRAVSINKTRETRHKHNTKKKKKKEEIFEISDNTRDKFQHNYV